MTSINRTMHGIVHGKIIELDEAPNCPDGHDVTVTLRSVPKPGSGMQESFGSWSDDGEMLDEFLNELRQSRAADRRVVEE